jgi:cytochrome c553
MSDYKSGARKNAIMAAQAQALSKADIENLAAYYASLPGSLKTRR